jgi:diguanylate cyclase (GGDEF)-like protein/PAS domain S-box-containing protein
MRGAVQELLGTLMADQAVRCAELFSGRTGERLSLVPPRIGCTGEVIDVSIEMPLDGPDDDRLVVHLSTAEIAQARQSRRELALIMLVVGLAIALGACWFGFRLIVGRPLDSLLQAIRLSERSGEAHLAPHASNDEIGRITGAFNDMQTRMQADANRLRQAFLDLDRIYNITPALLCATDADGVVTSVSDHWLAATGFARDDVLGQPLARFLPAAAANTYACRVRGPLARGDAVVDVPLRLKRRDGTELDILLSGVDDQGPTAQGSSHLFASTDISDLRSAERRLEHLALTDPLCELPNRRGFLAHLHASTDRRPVSGMLDALLFIDLDNFKWVNDTYGHHVGDKLLVAATGRLRSGVRPTDVIARLGGDEFAIICHGLQERAAATRLADELIERLRAPFDLDGVRAFVSASIGIAFTDWENEEPDQVLRFADLAMYTAKQDGKNTHVVYNRAIGQKAVELARIRELISDGLERDWFSLVYQPIIDARTGRTVGIEALLRLACPTRGTLGPDRFIPIAEETGQIIELGHFALLRGVADLLAVGQRHGSSELYLAVNLSPRQLDDRLEETLDAVLAEHPGLAGRLVLEITETMLLQRPDDVARRLHRLRDRGIRIALDDFGTGYSSLSHIQHFPVDIIKIDKSFIRQLTAGAGSRLRPLAMIRATASLGQELGIEVVAEGVEATATIELLRDCGITLLQGYLYAKPMDRASLDTWLGRQHPPSRRPAPGALATFPPDRTRQRAVVPG